MHLNQLTKFRLRQRLAAIRPRLYRVALAWCGEHHRADDLVQNASAKALEKLHQLSDSQAFDPWVFSILNNCFKDYLRSNKDEIKNTPIAMEETTPSAEDEVMLNQQVQDIREAISRLVTAQREVLILIDIEGFSYAETASILNLPVGTVMSRLNRARKKLHQRLINRQQREAQPATYLKRIK